MSFKKLQHIFCGLLLCAAVLLVQPARAMCTDAVCLSGGNALVDINAGEGELINTVLSALLPGSDIQLSALGWNGLAEADVNLNLLLELLAVEAGVGSARELARSDITLLQLLNASADAVEADGDLLALQALNQLILQIDEIENDNIGGQLVSAATFPLSDILDIDFETGNLVGTELNVLNLFASGVEAVNYNSLVDVQAVPIEEGSPLLNALGLGGLARAAELKIKVIEPARFRCGPVGTQFNSAAVRVKLELDLLDLGLADSPLIANALSIVGATFGSSLSIEGEAGKIAVYYDIARAEGEVIAIDTAAQTAAVRAVSNPTDVYLGRFDDEVFFDQSRTLDPDIDLMPAIITRLDVGIDTPLLGQNNVSLDVNVRSHSRGTRDEQILFFSPPLPDTQSTESSNLSAAKIAGNLLNNLELEVSASVSGNNELPIELAGITDVLLGALDPVIELLIGDIFLGTIEPMINGLINSVVADLLGVTIGAARFTLHGVGSYCDINGRVYLDANGNQDRNAGERGVGEPLFVKLIPLEPSQQFLAQAVPVDQNTGEYQLGILPPGRYRLILDDNDVLDDDTPSLPSGFVNTEQFTGEQLLTVRGSRSRPGDFGVLRGSSVVVNSFLDNGAEANNGLRESDEAGLANATFDVLLNAAVVATGKTRDDGSARLFVAHTEDITFSLCERELVGFYSTGASAQPAGNYSAETDCLEISLSPGGFAEASFGNVPNNQFQPPGRQAAQAGAVVNYPHRYTAGTAGRVDFSLQSEWSANLFSDTDCDGVAEQPLPVSVELQAAEQLCLVARVAVPGDSDVGERDVLQITADFTPAGFAEVADQQVLNDLTYVVGGDGNGGITLTKSADVSEALPGESVTYNLAYSNLTDLPISDVVINDSLPEWTLFESASCVTPLPEGITGCSTESGVGRDGGGVRWTLTGSLQPMSSGSVEFTVRVEP